MASIDLVLYICHQSAAPLAICNKLHVVSFLLEALYTKTLTGNKKHLGSEHLQTLHTIGNLVNIYQQQG